MYESRSALCKLHLIENPLRLLPLLPFLYMCHDIIFDDLRDEELPSPFHTNRFLLLAQIGHLLYDLSTFEVQRRWERCGQLD